MVNKKVGYIIISFIAALSIYLGIVFDHLNVYADNATLWILVIIFLSGVVFVLGLNFRRHTKETKDYFELINPILIVFTFYTMMLPINDLISSRFSDPVTLFQYVTVAYVGLAGLLAGYFLFQGSKIAERIPRLTIGANELWLAGTMLLAVGLLSFAVNVLAFGGLARYFGMGYGAQRYLIIRQQTTFGYGWEWIGLSMFLFLVAALKQKRRRVNMLLVAFIVLWIVLSFWLGYRRPILYYLFILLISYNYLFKQVRLWPILIAAVVFYVILVAYGYTRSYLPKFGVLRALSETVGFAFRRPDLVLPIATGEFNLVARSIIEILSAGIAPMKFGESYATALLAAIPGMGRIMGGQLLDLGEWRVITFYPGLYEAGAGLGFHILAEGLLNFGLPGVFLHMFGYGFVARLAYKYLCRDPKDTLAVVLYASTVPIIVFDAIRSDLTASFFKWTHTYLCPLLLVMGLAYIINRTVRKGTPQND
ncbi:O-antigen polysaccharide polymerase Wzy [candidate division WOR-3 bacterium]|nr:O-antigen polysaccharide polymerase Wzy [candidate division WOR-3 bacterium]